MQTIFIIGDSTVENGNDPYYGWGGQLQTLLPGQRVENHAFSGRSSKSFWDEKRFVPVAGEMREKDLLLIGFGHNDEKDDPERHTDPDTTFVQHLMLYVKAARESGAVPVLCTSVCRNYINDKGFVLYTHGAYPQAVRSLCQREAVALIDLELLTRELLRTLGMEKADGLFVNIPSGSDERFPLGVADRTHFNLTGATTVAQIVAQKLTEFNLLKP